MRSFIIFSPKVEDRLMYKTDDTNVKHPPITYTEFIKSTYINIYIYTPTHTHTHTPHTHTHTQTNTQSIKRTMPMKGCNPGKPSVFTSRHGVRSYHRPM